jgi:hypothetical protein
MYHLFMKEFSGIVKQSSEAAVPRSPDRHRRCLPGVWLGAEQCGVVRGSACLGRACQAQPGESGRLDLNQRPFGPQPNALFVRIGAVECGPGVLRHAELN